MPLQVGFSPAQKTRRYERFSDSVKGTAPWRFLHSIKRSIASKMDFRRNRARGLSQPINRLTNHALGTTERARLQALFCCQLDHYWTAAHGSKDHRSASLHARDYAREPGIIWHARLARIRLAQSDGIRNRLLKWPPYLGQRWVLRTLTRFSAAS